MLPIHIFTIVKDGIPWIRHHLPVFEKLDRPWHWHIVEGTAANVNCTRWCAAQPPGLSTDGTFEYLNSIIDHPNVSIQRHPMWEGGKVQMCNAALAQINEPCVLVQIDADELHTTDTLKRIAATFDLLHAVGAMEFKCRFFVGPDIIVTQGGSELTGIWKRAWRFKPGMLFAKHEPPTFRKIEGVTLGVQVTEGLNLFFDHASYVIESQVLAKERFYKYHGAVKKWRRLQLNRRWPITRLKTFLPFVPEEDGAIKIKDAPPLYTSDLST